MTRPAIFIDRDGTVSEEVGYMFEPSRFQPFPWTGPSIRRINDSGIKVFLATNQSGVGRGYFDVAMVDRVHALLAEELGRHGAALDAVYYCPHAPEADCECRKPRPGMLLRAAREFDIDLKSSFMIGDRYVDVRTARAVGARSILVRSGDGRRQLEKYLRDPEQPDFIADDLSDAVNAILQGVLR